MPRSVRFRLILFLAGLSLIPAVGRGQTSSGMTASPSGSAGGPATSGMQVVIKREAVQLIDPQKYKVSMQLEPYQSVDLTAPFDSIVRQLVLKPNAATTAQAEAVRLENTIQRLELEQAKANLKAAQIEQKRASATKDEDAAALAQAHVDAAKAAQELAQFQFDRATVRAPFAGQVYRTFVVEGEFVRAGQPLMQVGSNTKLRVEIPAERSAVEAGKPYSVQVEDASVEGKVEAVLPLSDRFGTLRELFESVVSAVIVIDNTAAKLKAGQTVYVPLVPRQAITEVPASSISNAEGGQRKVQVVRQGVVRDIAVTLMGSVGPQRLYVSGPFAPGDEVIYELSHPLADGTRIQPSVAATAGTSGATAPGKTGAANPPERPTTGNTGF